MTKADKITKRAEWRINHCSSIVNATYRRALSYLVNLRVQHGCNTFDKPVFVRFYNIGVYYGNTNI